MKMHRELIFPLVIVISSTLLFFASLYSFLLFHMLVELFTVLIAFSVFVIAWSSRKYIDNIFLLIIGAGYFFVGSLDLLHMLSYDGMDMLAGYGKNLPTQLWVAARYLEVASFIGAFLFLAVDANKEIKVSIGKFYKIFLLYAIAFLAIIFAIFYLKIFPDAYIEGMGLTPFKIYSEYIISFFLFIALIILFRKRQNFDREMVNLLSLSMIMKIFSELLFTQYIGVYDFSNVLGHVFRFISFLLLYKAFFEVGLDKPYQFLFLNLKKSEERYRALVEFSPDPILVHHKGDMLFVNEPALKLLGIADKKDVIGRKLIEFISPRYKEIVEERIKKVFSGELRETPRTEIEVLHIDGRVIPVEVKGMKIFYEGREAVMSIMRDISERKEAEKKLRSLAQFPEENPNPVIRVLSSGHVQYANKPARIMLSHFKWKEENPIPEPLLGAVKKVIENNDRPKMELECRCGNIFHIELVPSLTDGHVNIYGRNITDRKIAEKKLAEAQAELQRRTEDQLVESYQHMGIINRKISLLLELEENFKGKKGKQEMIDYVLSSALSLSQAKIGMIYVASGPNHFSLLSSAGLEDEKIGKMQMMSGKAMGFIAKLIEGKKRVNSPCRFEESSCFMGIIEISYFVALPILKNNHCAGFMFLGFVDRESMDPQELEFLDVFAKHVSSAFSDFKILE